MLKKINMLAVVLGFFALTLFSCSKESSTSTVQVRLTDAPGDFQEVNIDVQGVEVNSTSANDGWTVLSANKGIYNLLKLTNGLDVLLGQVDLPAGKLSQVRLILGPNNTVKINGAIIALNTPSAQQSGLKLKVNADLNAGIPYKLLLDFDASRSIVSTGSGKYNLKPVIRVVAEAQAGAIKGSILPLDSNPAIYALSGLDTLSTTFPDASGAFVLQGLGTGSYTVSFQPKGVYITMKKENVAVTVGKVTDIGAVLILK